MLTTALFTIGVVNATMYVERRATKVGAVVAFINAVWLFNIA